MENRTEIHSGASDRYQWAEWQLVAVAVLAILLVYEQVRYMRRGKHLPGPGFVVPFLGGAISMVRQPTKFWDEQAANAKKVGMSWNVIFGRFIVFVRDSEVSLRIFANVRPDAFQVVGHPFGKKLFGESNLIFMYGDEHRDLRRRLAPNFTLKALGVYVSIQERIIRKHIAKWLEEAEKTGGEPMKMRLRIRDMNLETSQQTFVGPYMSDEARVHFKQDYMLFNDGLMTLPLDLPGCAYHKARLAVPRLVKSLKVSAGKSKLRMANGEEPACLADFWMADTIKEIREAEAAGNPPPSHTSDEEIGGHIFDFLFASQDATTSALTWAIAVLESHPKILERVREDQRQVRPDPLAPISAEQVKEMVYTNMVVRELLRYRPPATMVPHIAMVDFHLTDTYKVPKGTIVFPSLLESSSQGFTNPDTFDPERFSPSRQEDVLYKRNFLAFGAGPHQCVGQRYAFQILTLFIALFSTTVDWNRELTPGRDELAYTPTIAPKDDGFVRLSPRPALL